MRRREANALSGRRCARASNKGFSTILLSHRAQSTPFRRPTRRASELCARRAASRRAPPRRRRCRTTLLVNLAIPLLGLGCGGRPALPTAAAADGPAASAACGAAPPAASPPESTPSIFFSMAPRRSSSRSTARSTESSAVSTRALPGSASGGALPPGRAREQLERGVLLGELPRRIASRVLGLEAVVRVLVDVARLLPRPVGAGRFVRLPRLHRRTRPTSWLCQQHRAPRPKGRRPPAHGRRGAQPHRRAHGQPERAGGAEREE